MNEIHLKCDLLDNIIDFFPFCTTKDEKTKCIDLMRQTVVIIRGDHPEKEEQEQEKQIQLPVLFLVNKLKDTFLINKNTRLSGKKNKKKVKFQKKQKDDSSSSNNTSFGGITLMNGKENFFAHFFSF